MRLAGLGVADARGAAALIQWERIPELFLFENVSRFRGGHRSKQLFRSTTIGQNSVGLAHVQSALKVFPNYYCKGNDFTFDFQEQAVRDARQ
jgi:hypothetical protein